MAVSHDPVLYDIVISGTFLDDVAWYRSKVRETGGSVLELGAGTVRISDLTDTPLE